MSGNRPEARPLPLDVLDHYQVQAIERMSETLLNALQALKHIPRARDSKNSDLDHFRASNNFFLSGEAGSGKTTTYLSLREALKSLNPCSEANKLKLTHFFRLKQEEKRLVWLEPLDLESAPEVGNFLAAVLIRIEAEINKEFRTEKRRRGILENDESDALQEYERLQNDVVLAWEGNIPQRAEHLDPEVYALEVVNAAKASTKVKLRLQRALEELFAEEGREQQRLFVLPIDDFYLHPSSSLKLLRLLRMISVPQLFSLIMGDLHTLEELVYQGTLGKLLDLAGEQALGKDDNNRQWGALSSVATVLSADSLRKLIPMGQRFHLAVMHQLGALEFLPPRLDPPELRDADSYQDWYSLKDLLDLLPVKVPLARPIVAEPQIQSLLKFLRLRPATQEKEGDKYYTYSGLTILDLPPREVVDFWYSIKSALPDLPNETARNQVTPGEAGGEVQSSEAIEAEREKKMDSLRAILWEQSDLGWDATLGIVADATRESIFGQTYISKEDQDFCGEAVRGPRGYAKKAFASEFLKVEPYRIPILKVSTESGSRFAVYIHQGWSFFPNRPGLQRGDNLAPRPTAWLTVLHDLMSLSGEDRLAGEPLTPSRFGLGLVELIVPGSKPVGWPTPRWVSFWHFDRLGFAWRGVVDKASKMKRKMSADRLLEWLAFYWIRYIADILLSTDQEIDSKPQDDIEAFWEKLIDDLSTLWRVSSENEVEPETREMVRDWLIDLATMLELAVPKSVYKRFEKSRLDEFWKHKEPQTQGETGSEGERDSQ
jgi:hypothetical protein